MSKVYIKDFLKRKVSKRQAKYVLLREVQSPFAVMVVTL